MQLRIEEVSPVEKKLVVEVPWATVSDKLGAAYRELAKSVNLKGFRKGKVPRSVLEQMFGKRVKQEVADALVRESFLTATSEHKLEPVSEPRVDAELQIRAGQPFAFEAIVEVKGQVEPKDYTGMELTKRPVVVTDQALEQAISHLQREHTELLPIEGRDQLAAGDVCAFAVEGTVGERPISQPQMMIDLDDREREPLPGLVDAMIGLSFAPDAEGNPPSHKLEIQMPGDHSEPAVAGQTAKLELTLLQARRKEVPELDDDFAKDTGKAESLEALRGALRDELAKQAGDQIENELRDAALRELVKRNPIPIAASLIDRTLELKLRRLQQMFGVQAKVEDIMNGDMMAKLRDESANDVRGQLLVDAVADVENIQVADEDVDRRVAEIAEGRNQQPARLRAEMDRDGRLDNLRFQLRQEKALDFLISRASVTEKEPDPADAQHGHEHAHEHEHGHVHGPDCDHDHAEVKSEG